MTSESGRSHRVGRLMLAIAIVVPPLAEEVGGWGLVRAHPVAVLLAFLTYELLVLGAGLIIQAYSELQRGWSDRLVEAVEAALRRRLSRYGRRYRRFLVEAHRDVDLRGPVARLPMEDILIAANLLLAREAGEPPGTPDAPGSPNPGIWQHLKEAEHGVLVLLGGPGAGKTTLLKHMTLTMARNRRAGWPVGAPRYKTPILLCLREHAAAIAADPTVPLAELARRSGRPSGPVEPPRWFDQQLATGRCLVLLDGLDEVSRYHDRRTVVDWMNRQITAHPRCRFVLTSRPSGDARPLSGDARLPYGDARLPSGDARLPYGDACLPLGRAGTLWLAPITADQIGRFVLDWHLAVERSISGTDGADVRQAAQASARVLLEALRTRPELADLTRSPLSLTMLANVRRHGGVLPADREELYAQLCKVLVRPLARSSAGIGPGLPAEQTLRALRVLARAMTQRRISDICAVEAADILAPALAAVRPQLDPQDLLAALARDCGLLVRGAGGSYSFAHRTLQAYLAADGPPEI